MTNGKEDSLQASLPILRGDLLLVHAPAFFDFRDRRDIYFPFLGTSGDVPITPLYEYFPIGFKMLARYLTGRGYQVSIINLSTVLLRYPKADIRAIVESWDFRLIGIDLHWMVHVQGSLAVAACIKAIRTDLPIVFGGISSTYYASELSAYPYVDMVLRGYDTLDPMVSLLEALKEGREPLAVPNLVWKSRDGRTHHNAFSHKPKTYGIGVDWSSLKPQEIDETLPILEFLSTQNAGCAYNCGWCGGSREAFRRVFDTKQTMARKSVEELRFEFATVNAVAASNQHHFYSVGSYNEPRSGMERFLDLVAGSRLKSISYEQFHLTPDDILKRMAAANRRTTITLSPESHDPRVARLAGRGVYTNNELEKWIERALAAGIYNIDIWYFIGMPEQDADSVKRTVDYCVRLLGLFKGRNVNPMLCPMIPFLDPASTFFEYPEEHGYRVFYRTVEQHRRGMESASLINRINYETRWLSREELVYFGFRAVRDLMQAKAEHGCVPRSWVRGYNAKIDDALDMIRAVHECDCLTDEGSRAKALEALGAEIHSRNEMIFYSGVANQAFPVNRSIGGRWFDEMGWPAEVLDGQFKAMPSAAEAAASA